MRRERISSLAPGPNGNGSEPARVARTTVFLTDALVYNLDLCALRNGKAKGEIVREALAKYLESQGFRPHLIPQIDYRYEP